MAELLRPLDPARGVRLTVPDAGRVRIGIERTAKGKGGGALDYERPLREAADTRLAVKPTTAPALTPIDAEALSTSHEAEGLLAEAHDAVRAGRYRPALVLIERLLAVEPRRREAANREGRYLRAVCQYRLGDLEAALRTLRELRTGRPALGA